MSSDVPLSGHGHPVIPALKVEGLFKSYRLDGRAVRTFREAISDAIRLLARRSGRSTASGPATFWALRDISFQVREGEAVGLIGRNGAGKSTLLKVLSRITWPTAGRAEIRGRVASLLEVGTGFHPELSGRENVYLSGALHGMSKAEIRAKFDQIVDFAEIERFLDTPTKHYSSGMYLRLAFAVAAHLDVDILFVDEVLAVGDAAFQKKCIAKMTAVSGAGRTILFVSHNVGAVIEFCPRSLWLSEGRLVADGSSVDIVRDYLAERASSSAVDLRTRSGIHEGPGPGRIVALALCDGRGAPSSSISHGDPFRVAVTLGGTQRSQCILAVSLRSALGVRVVEFNSSDDGFVIMPGEAETTVLVGLDSNCLNDGDYYISATLWNRFYQLQDRVEDSLVFASRTHVSGLSRSTGIVKLPAKWAVEVATREDGPWT